MADTDWLAAAGWSHAKPRTVLRFNQHDQIIHAAVAGQGIALGRLELIAPLLADGRLVTVPTIAPGVAQTEEAPIESIHIPAGAKNKADAMKLLAFMMRADVQTTLNKTLRQLPANTQSQVSDDRFLKAGAAQLDKAAHLTQFLDRDTSEDLATVAMKGFQEFMVKPERLDTVLANIERARKRIYAAN